MQIHFFLPILIYDIGYLQYRMFRTKEPNVNWQHNANTQQANPSSISSKRENFEGIILGGKLL